MNRSLYPEGVEVHQRHLVNTESTKAAAIDEVVVDTSSRGVVSGLTVTVTVAPNNTRVDVAAGAGYAPNGEYMQLATPQTAQQLADSTLGAVNYVVLMYDELNTSPESHETDGGTRNTKALVSPRVVVLTTAQYLALPATNTVLSSNALDRALVLALVTGNGAGIPLTGTSIQLPTSFQNTLQTNQPTHITGVTIIQLDTTTPTGTGTLSYNAGTQQITWQAPTEGSPGVGVTISTSGIYTVTSFTGHVVTLNVASTLLPVTNQTDSISITNIYTQTISRYTAVDGLHRSLMGSGVPTTKNPHGLTLEDLAPGTGSSLNEHQNIEHSNGIARQSSSGTLACVINTTPAPDQLQITPLGPTDIVYVRGAEIKSIVGSNVFTFLDGSIQASTYLIYMSSDATIQKMVRASYPGVPLLADKTFIANVSDNIGTGSKNLTWTSTGTLIFDSGVPIPVSTAVDRMFRVYSQDNISFIDVWVKASATPVSNQTDSITFTALPSLSENLMLAYVPWSGSSTGFLGFGFGAANSPNHLYDRRLFGNMAPINMRDDTGLNTENMSEVLNSVIGDGVFVETHDSDIVTQFNNQFLMGTLSGLTIKVNGGTIIVGGRLFHVPTTTINLTDNSTNRIYVDNTGIMRTSTQSASSILASQEGRPFQYLWSETLVAAAETARSDLRTYTGAVRGAPLGVAPLDINDALTVTGQPNTVVDVNAITSTGAGSGSGIVATGGVTGGIGVTGNGGASGGLGGLFTSDTVVGGDGVHGTGYGDNGKGAYFVGGQGTIGVQGGTGVIGIGTGSQSNGGDFQSGGPGGYTLPPSAAHGAGVYGRAGQSSAHGVYGTAGNSGVGVFGDGGTAGHGVQGQAHDNAGLGFVGGRFFGSTPTNAGGFTGGNGVQGNGGNGVHGTGGDFNGGNGGTFTGGAPSGGSAVGGFGISATGGTNRAAVYAQGGSTTAIESNGNVVFDNANPATSTGFANTQTPKNLVKAWARIDTTGGVVSIRDGFNVTSAVLGTLAGGHNFSVDVTLTTAFDIAPGAGHTYFGIVVTGADATMSFAGFANSGTTASPPHIKITGSQFTYSTPGPVAIDQIQFDVLTTNMTLVVLGEQ